MVDLHAHILPGIDDGAVNIEESLQMCQLAYDDGIRAIVATPHVGKFKNTKEIIEQKTEDVRGVLAERSLGITLYCGADAEFGPDIFSLLAQHAILTIHNSRYLLLDSPQFLLPPNIEGHIARVIENGIVPIISHPERCLQMQESLSTLYRLVKLGVLVQVTASSITGGMGSRAQQAVRTILKHDLAHVIATDTHGVRKRPPVLSEAVSVASKIIGKESALRMVTTTPQDIIDNKPIAIPEPKNPR